MATTSTTSSIISTLGAGSGVDMAKLASDLAEARFMTQVSQLTTRNDALEAKISAAATLKSQLTQLSSAVGDRIRNGDLSPTATVGNSSVAQVSVLPGSTPSGSFSLEVIDLAASQTLASKEYGAATDLVGEGQLTIRFGDITNGQFNEDSGHTAAVIDVTDTDTLEDVATKIRASGAGLSAYVANTVDGPRLVVKGQDGADNAFVIEATGASVQATAVPGAINYLAWDPTTDAGELKNPAGDAHFMFDGVEMTSTSNQVTGLPSGLVLTLTGTNENAPTQIGFADKSKQITTMMSDFVAALNDIASSLSELANAKGGDLGSDPGARALKRALSGLSTKVVMPNAGTDEPSTLADLGLAVNRDGTFRLDSQRLEATLKNNLAAAGAMFTTGLFGVYSTVDSLARSVTASGDPGTLGGSIQRYTDQKERIADRLATIAEQQEKLREQLAKQFTWADQRVTSSQSTLSFLQSQIDAWNSSRN